MIKQVFDVEGYWKVVVYYDLDPAFFNEVEFELRMIDFPRVAIEEAEKELLSGKAKAVTCSSTEEHTSIVIFNPHSSKADYISSIVHEAEHIKQSMLKAYNVEDRGEPSAYTVGYIVMRMYEVFKTFMFTC